MAQYSLPHAADRLKKEKSNSLVTLTQKQAKVQELTKTMQVSAAYLTFRLGS